VWIALILTPPPDAVMLFRDVGEAEKVRERARDRQRALDRHPRKLCRQLGEVRFVAGVSALGQRAHTLNRIEELVTLLSA
jgi:hypothetical protein